MQQQLSGPARVMVEDAGLFVRGDMRLNQPGFLAICADIGFCQAHLPGAD